MKTYSVIWTINALTSLQGVFNFYAQFSHNRAKELVTRLVTLGNSLSTLPFRFPIEPLVSTDTQIYRFATLENYKMIYAVEEKSVMIVLVFDTRRNPDELILEDL